MCYGQHMQHGIGGAAQRDDDADGVFEGVAREDVARANALCQQFDHSGASTTAVICLVAADRFLR